MKKKLSAVVLTLLLFLLVSCVKTTEFTVTFDSNGGTSVESVIVKEGDKVPEPSPEPTYDGYSFEGWFDGDDKFEFNVTIIDSDLTLVAKWNKLNTDTIPPAFRGAVNGKLPGVDHLKGEEIDFLENVSAIDETSGADDIVIEVIDF